MELPQRAGHQKRLRERAGRWHCCSASTCSTTSTGKSSRPPFPRFASTPPFSARTTDALYQARRADHGVHGRLYVPVAGLWTSGRHHVALALDRDRGHRLEPRDWRDRARHRLSDPLLHALPGGDWRGRLRAGRAGHAVRPLSGRSSRPGDVVVLHGHPGRQCAGLRDRFASGRDLARLARCIYHCGLPRHRARRALLLHEGTAAKGCRGNRSERASTDRTISRSCASEGDPVVCALLLPG